MPKSQQIYAELRSLVAENQANGHKLVRPKPQPTKYDKHPQKYPTNWTHERVELLKKLCAENVLSFSQMAERIGSVTRNAVIGKVHRLGLLGRTETSRRAVERRVPRRTRAILLKPITPPRPAPILVPVLDDTPSGGYKLTDLTERMCHWPHGDPMLPGFSFCGAPKEFGTPYCPHHDHIAHKQERTSKNRNGFYWLDLEGRNERAAIAKAGA